MSSIVLVLILTFLSLAEAKFTRGDDFRYVNIDGSLTITCKNRTKTVTCRDVFMDPWPYDLFVGPRNINAQSVELRSTVGSESQTAIIKYDGRTGKSSEVNLGVFSLFQKPLLKVGQNKIRFALLGKEENVLETDTFEVSVTRGKSRTCEPRQTETQNIDDCEYSYSLCQLYFRNQNYCR